MYLYQLARIPNHLFNLKSLDRYFLLIRNTVRYTSITDDTNKVNDKVDFSIKQDALKHVYNTELEKQKLGFKRVQILTRKNEKKQRLQNKLDQSNPIPISLRYISDAFEDSSLQEENKEIQNVDEPLESKVTQFPFVISTKVGDIKEVFKCKDISHHKHVTYTAEAEIRNRNKAINNWMTNYDNYDDKLADLDHGELNDAGINYGTPDSSSAISNIPCGGCGALLHCKDVSIPGYIPSEIFKNASQEGGSNLQATLCQRCYFLKNYNIALQVRVSSDDYPKVLQTISMKNALVVIMVDLLDFPCSIWPGIADIFSRMPILVVGNKVDLLPQDSDKYLAHVKEQLLNSMRECGFGSSNIINVSLISATTGYGIEDLITILHGAWKHKGDVYLVGCTNVGKSSLYNALLQSDYCKSQATDLIQKATTSLWPGTTLNLLKFPIAKPVAHKIHLRYQRLKQTKELESRERALNKDQLRITKDPKYAVLTGHVHRTVAGAVAVDENMTKDLFNVRFTNTESGKHKLGIDEKDPVFALGRWCYDTPGVVQPDQIIHLLTAEELLITLPKALIRPRTYCVKPNSTLFIAGLARLDYLKGRGSIRFTVFCSNELPLTICNTDDADKFYEDNLGSNLLKVPINTPERLEKWPGLEEAKKFTVTGIYGNFSCKDVVLSNAGWISITGARKEEYNLRAWTPEKRGVYLRDSLLPSAVALRGNRIRFSPAYKSNKLYLK